MSGQIDATFVRSAASASDLPRDGLAALVLVGRSNVGKSSLINALTRRTIARTSAAPGKTRLANVYRVRRGAAEPLHIVDLPGFGYARGAADEFRGLATDVVERSDAALLLVDARHPGLENDREAWRWLTTAVPNRAIAATKIDKLSRAQRLRALRELEAVFEHPVAAVSADTGEGLDELWKLIDRLANSSNRLRSSPPPPSRTAAADTRRRRPPKNSSSRRSRT